MAKHFAAYDTNDSDTLDRAQLATMLFHLNGDRHADESEIDWIMSCAPGSKGTCSVYSIQCVSVDP